MAKWSSTRMGTSAADPFVHSLVRFAIPAATCGIALSQGSSSKRFLMLRHQLGRLGTDLKEINRAQTNENAKAIDKDEDALAAGLRGCAEKPDISVLAGSAEHLNNESDIISSPTAVAGSFERLRINLDLLLYKARVKRQMRREKEAEAILRECIRDWPYDGRAYVSLGGMLVRRGDYGDARKIYEDGCQAARGENPYIWQAWAVLEERSGDISRARALFDASTVADKKHAAAWHGWAVLEFRNGSMNKAKYLLNKGLKFCGHNEYFYQTLALIEEKAGEIEEARAYFLKATQVNARSTASWLSWALMESEYGFKASARPLFERALQACPKNRYVWQAWALFEAREGYKAKARELFQRGIGHNPRDVVLIQAYALFEYDCGNPVISRTFLKRAVTLDPKHQPLWLAWGWIEWKEGRNDAAREYYQKSLSVSSIGMNAVRTYQAWGVLEGRAGNYVVARALFRSALRLDPQNSPSWMSWATMEERQGHVVRANELRNLCFQQKTEVVEGSQWDVIEGLTELLNFDKWSNASSSSKIQAPTTASSSLPPHQSINININKNDPSFMLQEKPYVSGNRSSISSTTPSRVFQSSGHDGSINRAAARIQKEYV